MKWCNLIYGTHNVQTVSTPATASHGGGRSDGYDEDDVGGCGGGDYNGGDRGDDHADDDVSLGGDDVGDGDGGDGEGDCDGDDNGADDDGNLVLLRCATDFWLNFSGIFEKM